MVDTIHTWRCWAVLRPAGCMAGDGRACWGSLKHNITITNTYMNTNTNTDTITKWLTPYTPDDVELYFVQLAVWQEMEELVEDHWKEVDEGVRFHCMHGLQIKKMDRVSFRVSFSFALSYSLQLPEFLILTCNTSYYKFERVNYSICLTDNISKLVFKRFSAHITKKFTYTLTFI